MPFDYLSPPWDHQKQSVERASSLPHFALFHEQGCGKSFSLINILRVKFGQEKRVLRTLILCPPIVIQNWRQEIGMYSRIPIEQVKTLSGSFLSRIRELDFPGNNIYITNYQSLLNAKLFEKLLKMNFEVLVLDESHKIKNPKSKTTKAALKLSQQESVRFRYILSGTPVLNSALDIFPQFLFLDGGKTFGERFDKFRAEHYVDFNEGMPAHVYFPKWVMRPETPEKLNRMIQPISSRVLKKDCLDLPPLVRQRVEVPLLLKQAKIYKELEEHMVAALPSGENVMSNLVITNILRLQQLITGYVVDDKQEEIHFDENPRSEALQEVLGSIAGHHKILIWAVFKPNYKSIRETVTGLNLVHREIHGGMSNDSKWKSVQDFNNDPSVRVLIGHPASAGIGINLVAASYSIFYSRGFSLENDLQAEARNYRAGSERHESITRIDLVTPGTIDEIILNALASKQNLSDAILQHYKRGTYVADNP